MIPFERWLKSEIDKPYNEYDHDAKVRHDALVEVYTKLMSKAIQNVGFDQS